MVTKERRLRQLRAIHAINRQVALNRDSLRGVGDRNRIILPKETMDADEQIMDLSRKNRDMFGEPIPRNECPRCKQLGLRVHETPFSSFQLESTEARMDLTDPRTGFNPSTHFSRKQMNKILEASRR